MNKGTVQVLSFASGLTLTAVVLGVTLSRNEALRAEVESQLNTLLGTTRALVDALKSITSKASAAASLMKNDKGDNDTQAQKAAEQQSRIDSQWDAAEESLVS